jgi:hypothetical protein
VAFVVGIAVGLGVGVFATLVGLDRDRAFYPTVMIVIAFYYALFAAMSGSVAVLMSESVPIFLFCLAAVLGFKRSLWFVAAALVAHGVFDFSHRFIITDPGVPAWWPSFCMAADVALGLYLAWLLYSDRITASNRAARHSAK